MIATAFARWKSLTKHHGNFMFSGMLWIMNYSIDPRPFDLIAGFVYFG